ncbi:MAG: tetratricopeptide repeat protein [Candidatus Riflebacteria bacterium]|nr:tetratricopeptide repeat protein [Candidatus Riflebacteria bacterium]
MKRHRFIVLALLVAVVLLQINILEASTAKFHVDVGLNHFYKNRYLEAYREFKAALDIDPRYPEAHYNLGRVYKAQGFIKEAIVQFQIAVQINPDYQAARRELQSMQQALASDVAAQQKIQGRETIQKTEFDTMPADQAAGRAREMLNQGRTDEAIRFFEVALREKPDDAGLNKMVGFLLFRQNRFSDALERYSKAQKGSPSDAEIPYAIGLIYMKTQTPDRAESFFGQAVKLQPSMIKAVFGLGEAYEAQERIEDAILQFRKCLELNPNLKEARDKLSYLAGRQSYNYYSRGAYFYQRGEYDKAEPLLSMAREYGNLTPDQNKQVDEMLNASRFWIKKQKEQQRVEQERRDTSSASYVGKDTFVFDVSRNPTPYIGTAVEWRGRIEFISKRKGRSVLFVNSQPTVNADNNMDYAFEVEFPKDLPSDSRIAAYANVVVKGKILRVDKLMNQVSGSFSSRRQPILEASEVQFERENYEQPLMLRFY